MNRKRRFFIYSLPRSGSSWLSVFLSQPGSYCYHEPFADNTWPAIQDGWDARSEKCVGLIDTSAHQRIIAHLDNCHYFVLIRDIKDVDSSLKVRGWVMDLDREQRLLKAKSENCIALYYRWFNDIGYLQNVWNSVTGDLPFDKERTEYLMEMNIQRTFASVKARSDKCRTFG